MTTRGPFLSLLRSFDETLEESTHLIIIEYPVRDGYINDDPFNWHFGSEINAIHVITELQLGSGRPSEVRRR